MTPFDLETASLAYSCGAWALPRSGYAVPVIGFSPLPGRHAAVEEDRRFIRFRCGEVVDAVETSHGLLIDLGELPASLIEELDPVPESIRLRDEPVRIVVPGPGVKLAGTVHPHEIVADRRRGMEELAFALKKYRFDGGTAIHEPGPLSPPRVEPVTLDPGDLRFSFHTWRDPRSGRNGGHVAIIGEYRPGSLGTDDALLIRWRLNQFCDAARPDALIVDLRQFEYTWGDDINLYPSRFAGPDDAIRFIVRPDQKAALAGEIYPRNFADDDRAAFAALT